MSNDLLPSGLYAPTRVRPTMLNYNNHLFMSNDRDFKQVLYDYDKSRTYDMGILFPVGFTAALDPGGPALNVGMTYRARVRFKNSKTGWVSNPSAEVELTTNATQRQINYNFPPHISKQVDKVVIEMTRPFGSVFYWVKEVDSDGSSVIVDTISSTEGVILFYDEWGHEPPPAEGRVIFEHKNRLWSCDFVDESNGTVALTGTADTTPVLTKVDDLTWWGPAASGRFFHASTAPNVARIDSHTDKENLILESGYGLANGTYNYRIYAPDRDIVRYSQSQLPESWNTADNFERIFTNNNDSPIGFSSFHDTLLVFGKQNIAAWSYDIDPDQGTIRSITRDRGAVNHECILNIDNVIYALDAHGIYKYHNGQIIHLSHSIDEILDGTDSDWNGLDYSKSDQWHACHNLNHHQAVWFVSLNRAGEAGKVLNRAIIFNYRTDGITLYEWANDVMSSIQLPDTNSELVPVIGTDGGPSWFWRTNTTDGVRSGQSVSGLAAAGSTTGVIEWNGGSLDTRNQGMSGIALVIPNVGSGIIASNTSAQITLMTNKVLAAAPSVGDRVFLGPIETEMISAHRAVEPDVEFNETQFLNVRFIPTATTHKLRFKFYFDYSTSPHELSDSGGKTIVDGIITTPTGETNVYEMDVSKNDGFVKIPINKAFKRLQVKIEGLEPDNGFQLTKLWLSGRSGESEIIF